MRGEARIYLWHVGRKRGVAQRMEAQVTVSHNERGKSLTTA